MNLFAQTKPYRIQCIELRAALKEFSAQASSESRVSSDQCSDV